MAAVCSGGGASRPRLSQKVAATCVRVGVRVRVTQGSGSRVRVRVLGFGIGFGMGFGIGGDPPDEARGGLDGLGEGL